MRAGLFPHFNGQTQSIQKELLNDRELTTMKIYEGQVTVEQARAFCRLFPELSIRSTYMDEKHGKMPYEYEDLDEALHHKERYGSIWLHLGGGLQRQVTPVSVEEYLKKNTN